MDLVSEMLLDQWRSGFARDVDARELELPIARVARRLPALAQRPVAFNVDRIVARFVTYPARALAGRQGSTLYHVADHTYAQLVHVLPSSRTGVYCHDLDAFRSLVADAGRAREARPAWFRALARIILRGMQSAAVVFHSTRAVGDEMRRLGIVDAARLVHAPYGVSPEFDATARASDGEALAPIGARRFVLHVGNALPRKRLDVLFDTFARLGAADPELRLVQQGAALSAEQQRHVRDAEGFGFPVIEALASGAVVVASDIPVLREVGGDAAIYCPPGDAAAWASTVGALLDGRHAVPSRKARLAQAARFTWQAHARTILGAYRRLDEERAR
jgi:glycosyltransferase involved in cell wall biosynthesis